MDQSLFQIPYWGAEFSDMSAACIQENTKKIENEHPVYKNEI